MDDFQSKVTEFTRFDETMTDNGEGEIPNGGEGRSWIFNRFRPSNKNGNSGSDKGFLIELI